MTARPLNDPRATILTPQAGDHRASGPPQQQNSRPDRTRGQPPDPQKAARSQTRVFAAYDCQARAALCSTLWSAPSQADRRAGLAAE